MRFRLLGAVILLGSIVSLSRADYIVIRINVKQPEATDSPPGQPPMRKQPGQPPIGQPPGQPPIGQPPPKVPPPRLQDGDYVMAVVELKGAPKKIKVKELPDRVLFLEHKWGKTAYPDEQREIQFQLVPPNVLKSPLVQYKERSDSIAKGGDKGLDRYFELALWCLEVGLPDRCQAEMNRIESLSTKDAKVSPKVAQALEAYKLVKPILADDVPKQEKANVWKQKLRYSNVAVSKHYALVHNSEDALRDGVQRRLDALENNFKTFYLLFALKGKALPAPAEKLPAILLVDLGAFNKVRQTFEVNDLVSDGFHARQDNLAVFAPNRLDEAWSPFNQEMQSIYRKYELKLLDGQFPDFGKIDPEELRSKAMQVARYQVYALVEAALQEESETAAATHEGTRQLFTATGLLPRTTPAPEWLRFGLASLFEMPKGPFPGKSVSMVRLAFWAGAGGPNWEWRRYFDEMVQDQLISEQPTELLWQTLNGAAFDRAKELFAKPKQAGGKDPAEAGRIEMARGRCLSWALTYYLFTDRFSEFLTFLNDLGNMPRDADLDQYLFLKTFCDAFHIDTAGLTPANLKGNLSAYDEFARNWIKGVKRVAAPAVNLTLEDPNAGKPIDPKNPNRPKN
jgi:hypothetical protein